MRLEIEGRPAVEDATERQVRSALKALRSTGPSSFASLTDDLGSYVQVAGGRVTCLLERREAAGRHLRAFHDNPVAKFADGTVLAFGGGAIALRSDEWFTAEQVADVFVAFLLTAVAPDSINWRDVTAIMAAPTDPKSDSTR